MRTPPEVNAGDPFREPTLWPLRVADGFPGGTAAMPEPGALVLLGAGGGGLWLFWLCRRRRLGSPALAGHLRRSEQKTEGARQQESLLHVRQHVAADGV